MLRFRLNDIILEYDPVNWDSVNRVISRSEFYFGMMRKFNGEYFFIKDGYQYLKLLQDADGINSECTLTVELYKPETGEFETLYTGKLDFTTYREVQDGTVGIKINCIDTSFAEKLMSREELEVDYFNLKTIDGETIEPFENETYTVLVKGTELMQTGEILVPAQNHNGEYSSKYWTFDLEVISGAFCRQNTFEEFTSSDQAFIVFDYNSTLKMNLKLKGSVLSWPGWFKIILTRYNSEGHVVLAWTLYEKISGGTRTININEDFIIPASQGDWLLLTALFPDAVGYYQRLTFSETKITCEISDIEDAGQHQAIMPLEAFTRVVHQLTNEQFAVNSDFFGKTENGYDSDGAGALTAILTGKSLRQFTEFQFNTSFKKLFSEYNKLFNLGLAIENDTVRIEPKTYFFDQDIVLDITGIEINTFDRTFCKQLSYNEIEVGYIKDAYEEIGVLVEYNNKVSYSTILAIKQKLDLLMNYRADMIGIELARREVYVSGDNMDSSWDDKVFFFDLERFEIFDIDFIQKTDEGFEEIGGISENKTYGNLNLTPARVLGRWGWMLVAGLQKHIDSFIKFNATDIPTTLYTKKTDETFTVYENADIKPSELSSMSLTGYSVKFKAPVTNEQFEKIASNPYGLIKFINPVSGMESYGWLKEVSTKPIDRETNWELWEANNTIIVLYGIITEDSLYYLCTENDYTLILE